MMMYNNYCIIIILFSLLFASFIPEFLCTDYRILLDDNHHHTESHGNTIVLSYHQTKTKTEESIAHNNNNNNKEPHEVHIINNYNASESIKNAILTGNVNEISRIVKENEDIKEIAKGFTFQSNMADQYLQKTENRISDTDVVSLKGLATASTNNTTPEKLADIYIEAIYGPDHLMIEESTHPICTEHVVHKFIENCHGDYKHHDEPSVMSDPFNEYITDEFGQDILVTSWYVTSQATFNSIDGDDRFYHWVTEIKISCTQERKEVKRKLSDEELRTIRTNLLESFRDTDLMHDIVAEIPDPNEEKRRMRSLMVTASTPVNSYLCAYCWKKKFCKKNASWCNY